MKIIGLTAENIKKLSVVEIRPDGNLVQITGKNGQGKTSVLDSIWWALAGAGNVQSTPIRKGQERARIRLDLGDIIVTRTFRDLDGEATTNIVVETAEGARFPSPQKMLDKLLGSLSFDPLAFTRMQPREQFNELRRFVPDVDFVQIDLDNKHDFDARTALNRDAKVARLQAEQIIVPSDLPLDEIDENALTAELEAAGRKNAEREARVGRREVALTHSQAIDAAIVEEAANLDLNIKAVETRTNETLADIERQIEQLQARQNKLAADCAIEVAAVRQRAASAVTDLKAEREKLNNALATAEPLPEVIDTAALAAALTAARKINEGIKLRLAKVGLEVRINALERASADLTAAINKRNADKLEKIGAAKMPVEGIGFGDGQITLAGVPFDQASDAEQLRSSIAIAMASNPKLRVIRVRDGSLLDEDGMRLLAEMADAQDCQVWVERVDSSEKVGFVLEDGHLKVPAAARQVDLLGAAD